MRQRSALALIVLGTSLTASLAWANNMDKMMADAKVAAAGKGTMGPFAEATLEAKSGSKVAGTVLFSKTDKGLQVKASVSGASPGAHGIHIHDKGDCSSPDGKSAGDHFNPTKAPHAGPDQATRHGGDLGNITVNSDGKGQMTMDLPPVAGMSDWGTIVGKSVVLHEKADDLKTQPAGDAGPRIGCGVIAAVKAKKATH